MTNFLQAKNSGRRGFNQKDGRRRQPVRVTGFWGLDHFDPTAPGKWLYTWQGIDCPTFEVIEAGCEIAVALIGGEIKATFINAPHIDVKNWLDDLILELIRRQCDVDTPPVDTPPMVVNGQEIGPEVAF